MIGTDMEEMRERLSWGYEMEFTYNGRKYVLQPEPDEDDRNKSFLVIWVLTPKAACICKYPKPLHGQIPDECLDAVLNDKCFDGKSFMEIEGDVTVDCL